MTHLALRLAAHLIDRQTIPTELEFDTLTHPRTSRCGHVDLSVLDGNVLLQPRCGIGSGRPADGVGVVGGFAAGGGVLCWMGSLPAKTDG